MIRVAVALSRRGALGAAAGASLLALPAVSSAALAAPGALPAPPPFPVPEADLAKLRAWHAGFPGSWRWRLGRSGVEVEGRATRMAYGEDAAWRAWSWFGPLFVEASLEFGVPVELLIATAATETVSGAASAKAASGARGGSGEVGLMQTLPATARMALGKPGLPAKALLDPRTSIRAGTAYMASQFEDTAFDPPLVGGAYNSGGVYEDRGAKNGWKLRCYPVGTGLHVTKFCGHFGDALALAGARLDRMGKVHSFARELMRA